MLKQKTKWSCPFEKQRSKERMSKQIETVKEQGVKYMRSARLMDKDPINKLGFKAMGAGTR